MADATEAFRRAVALHSAGDLLAARAAYHDALAAAPDNADALGNLAVLALQLGDATASERLARETVARAPDHANGWNNLGLALKSRGDYAGAEAAFRKCLSLDVRHEQCWNNLGEARALIGDLEGAIAAYGRALALKPDMPAAVMAYVHRKQQIASWDGLDEVIARMSRLVRQGRSGIEAFGLLFCCQDPQEILQTARNCAREIEASVARNWGGLRFVHRRERATRIRIGYVSANFHDHAVGTLIAQMLESHDRSRFKTHGYCHTEVRGGELRRRILASFDRFADIRELDDVAAAQLINADGIDILVDLMGYTKGQRLRIFALRPAALQVSWIGFAGSIGGSIMDYIVADRTVVPAGSERFYDEKILFMPASYQVNDARRALAPTPPSRAQYGLAEEAMVYCCFNQIAKITPPMLDLWARILKEVPGSLLWLWRLNEPGMRNLGREFAGRGIGPERLVWGETLEGPEHLSRYGLCDLFLDTFPYGGHATASNALYGGCPLLALPGPTFASRVSASLLKAVGLPELIAASPRDYAVKAVTLGRDRSRLAALKRHLVSARASSPLFDGARFARDLERGFAAMMEHYWVGRPADHIELESEAG